MNATARKLLAILDQALSDPIVDDIIVEIKPVGIRASGRKSELRIPSKRSANVPNIEAQN